MSPHRIFLIYLAMASTVVYAYAAEEVRLGSLRKGDGTVVLTYSVPRRLLEEQSPWKPGEGDCPLSLDQAVKIAAKWKKDKAWMDGSYLRYIFLSRVRNFEPERWCYSLYYDRPQNPPNGSNDPDTTPREVYILLDGSVVQPKNVQSGK